jgi:hypothetical protein
MYPDLYPDFSDQAPEPVPSHLTANVNKHCLFINTNVAELKLFGLARLQFHRVLAQAPNKASNCEYSIFLKKS